MAAPALHKISVNDVELAYFERGVPSDDKPTLLFVHATGFHARVYDRIIESFPDLHVVALEQRGHGRSQNVLIEHWRAMGEDMAAFVRALDLSELIGIGHSMGGHAMVDAAAISGAFARLVLLDPTIPSPEAYAATRENASSSLPEGGVHPASRRKRHFDSPEDMAERLLPKGAYALFEPRILDDYCRYGLLPDEHGGFTLACPPEVEASVYMAARSNGGVYESARSLDIPVTIMRARVPEEGMEMDFSSSPTWPDLVTVFNQGRDIHLSDCTHFIPMQMPDEVVGVIEAEKASWLAARGL